MKKPEELRQLKEHTEKCRATYTKKNGDQGIYDIGTLGSYQCQAHDEDGNPLFDFIPEGL